MMASAWIYNNAVTNHDNSWSLHFAIPDDKRLELVAATNGSVEKVGVEPHPKRVGPAS